MPTRIKYYLIIIAAIVLVSCKSKEHNLPETSKDKKTDLVEVNRILVKKDQVRIKNYISRKGWEMTETETGLWYEILTAGDGEKAVEGKVIMLNYTLSLLDGKVCYTSAELGPKQFLIGKGNVESGLEQGVLLLNQGSKARFIMPPHLAHGLPGDGNKIPARATIIYEIEILSVSNP